MLTVRRWTEDDRDTASYFVQHNILWYEPSSDSVVAVHFHSVSSFNQDPLETYILQYEIKEHRILLMLSFFMIVIIFL
jgi:hypothetical protein